MLRVMTLGLAPKKEKEHFFKRDEGIVPCHPEETKIMPGSYQRLDLFIKVLRVLCPNLTDASKLNSNKTSPWEGVETKEFPTGDIDS